MPLRNTKCAAWRLGMSDMVTKPVDSGLWYAVLLKWLNLSHFLPCFT